MTHVDSSVANGGDVLIALADQLPQGTSTGRPMIVTPSGAVMCADGAVTAVFQLDEDGQGVARVARLADGRAEVTTWRHRVETSRSIVSDGPDDDGGGGGGGGDDPEPPPDGPLPGGVDDPEFALIAAPPITR